MERWKEHPEFPRYLISDHGRIKNKNAGRILKPQLTSDGYHLIRIVHGGGEKMTRHTRYPQVGRTIHRLVLQTFLGYAPGMQCNHKDGIKTNNHLSNLEWITRLKNMRHARKLGLFPSCKGERGGGSKLKNGEVWLIRKIINSELYKRKGIKQWQVAKMFNVTHGAISCILRGKTWK